MAYLYKTPTISITIDFIYYNMIYHNIYAIDSGHNYAVVTSRLYVFVNFLYDKVLTLTHDAKKLYISPISNTIWRNQ